VSAGLDVAIIRHHRWYFFGALAADYDLRPRLVEIGVPTLVIVGRYDWICPPAASHALASQIPGADLVEIADAGHFGFSEEPEAFQNAIIAFLLSTSTRRPATAPA
jgi:proline iminopeptidase